MDHIPDEDGQRMSIQVPFLAQNIQYDGLGWETFPERAGYAWLQTPAMTVQDLSRYAQSILQSELQAFVQAWIYFGLLQEVYGAQYRVEDFLVPSEDDSGLVVTTTNLETQPAAVMTEGIEQLLKNAERKADLWDAFAVIEGGRWDSILLSIRVLIEALSQSSRIQGQPYDGRHSICAPVSQNMSTKRYTNGAAARAIRNHMLKQRNVWCPRQLDVLFEQRSYNEMVYLTGIKRIERPDVDHGNCVGRPTCVANNIPIGAEFITKHTTIGCTCANIQAPGSQRSNILIRGGIPVLRCTQRDLEPPELRFVPLSPSLKFVAISHLWADGLGNPFENSLPCCQLTRLMRSALKALPSWVPGGASVVKGAVRREKVLVVHIWLDVYCIPAQLSRRDLRDSAMQRQEKQLKAKAIARMGTTYALAAAVLVLDYELERSQLVPNDQRSRTLIHLSAWNTRCWTYQEYTFAQNTFFQSKDSLVTLQQAQDQNAFYSPYEPFQILRVRDVFSSSKEDAYTAFNRAWNSLAIRNTTQWNDIILVLAILLDLSAGQVSSFHIAWKIKALLATQTRLPLSMLFVSMKRLGSSTGKLEDRWIPKTFQPFYLSMSTRHDSMHRCEEGLTLNTAEMPSIKTLQASPTVGSHFFRWQMSWGQSSRLCWVTFNAEELLHCQEQAGDHLGATVIILLDLDQPLLGVDLSVKSRGACFVPRGPPTSGMQPVIYVGPVEWGFLDQDLLPEIAVANVKEGIGEKLLIESSESTTAVFGEAILT